ncbi:ankyrin repeat-containing domain protein [Lophiotrema nucula]|uniref:Ankyrin repeat-containing domain protein n=1 Tax=Lophiotrema nucula TaxID=690887 RepID=A0A6A5ZFS6_9PLEO|nr:ankyrin repeat-containing domain protein [Lophiotrema nucula]
MAKRAAECQEWERHKDEVHRLYVTEQKPLGEVMILMSTMGFTRSKSQYERVLKKWGFHKNLTGKEWRSISHRIEKRRAEGKDSEILFQCARVDWPLVQRRIARHGFQKIHPVPVSVLPEKVTMRTPSPTPMEIVIRPRSPLPMIREQSITQCDEASPSVCVDMELLITCGETTPWHKYTIFLRSLDQIVPGNLLAQPKYLNQGNTLECAQDIPMDVELLPAKIHSRVQAWFDDLIGCSYLEQDDYDYKQLSNIVCKTSAFLPRSSHEWSQINMSMASDIAHRSSQLEFLKLAVMLLSNNADVPSLKQALVELAQVEHNRLLLRDLLSQKLWSVSAFAEKLLPSVAEAGDLSLLKVLHQGGADINARPRPWTCTALIYAISRGHRQVVQYLLDNGADCSSYSNTPKGTFMLPLDYAVSEGNLAIVKLLLSGKRKIHMTPTIDIVTLNLAVRFEQYDLLEYLLDERPDLLDEFAQHPWIFLKEAVSSGDLRMLKTLMGYGLNVKRAMEVGEGGILVGPAGRGQEDLVLQLLRLGFDPSGIKRQNWCWTCAEDPKALPRRDSEKKNFGMAPLHISLLRGHRAISKVLIGHGANPNQFCRKLSPLHIAVLRGDKEFVQMLIEAGSKVDAISRGTDDSERDWDSSNLTCGKSKDGGSMVSQSRWEIFLGYNNITDATFEKELREAIETRSKPALQIAMELGDEDIFRLLIASGAEMPGIGSWNPWNSAFKGRNDYIIRHMESANLAHLRTDSTLGACISNCGTSVARTLISRGIIDPLVDCQQEQTLCAAIQVKDIPFTKFILSRVHDDNIRPVGIAGMRAAVHYLNIDAIRLLLEAGIKPYEVDDASDYSALEYVVSLSFERRARGDFVEAVRTLVEASTLSNAKTVEEEARRKTAMINAFHGTVYWSTDLSVVRLFLNAGVDVNITTATSPVPAIQLAMQNENLSVILHLLEVGAVVDPPAMVTGAIQIYLNSILHYQTPLQCAANLNNITLCRELLRRGATVNAKPGFGGATAIQYAAINGNFEILALLLVHGGHLNAAPAPQSGRYAIEGAAEMGRLDMVRFLIACGADIKGRTNIIYRRTVHRAWKEGHRALVRMIQDFKVREYGVNDIEDIDIIMSSMSYGDLWYTDPREQEACERLFKWRQQRTRKYPDPYRQPVVVRWEDFRDGASLDDADAIVF